MGLPQETTNKARAIEATGTVPANTNTLNVVALPVVDSGLIVIENKLADLKNAPVANIIASIADLQDTVTDLRLRIAAAAVEAVKRAPTGEIEITGAPAVILQRNRKVSGKDVIYMCTLNHRRIGRPLNIFTSSEDLGVMTINKGMTETGSLKGWHGFDGLKLGNDYGYEGKVFDAWKDGSGINKWVVMPMVVLSGKDYPGENKYFDGNLFDNRKEGDIKGTLTTSGSGDAKWYGSCTEHRGYPDGVWPVRFSDGPDGWSRRDFFRFSVRPCLAQELTL